MYVVFTQLRATAINCSTFKVFYRPVSAAECFQIQTNGLRRFQTRIRILETDGCFTTANSMVYIYTLQIWMRLNLLILPLISRVK